jgi:hypothetical protein
VLTFRERRHKLTSCRSLLRRVAEFGIFRRYRTDQAG